MNTDQAIRVCVQCGEEFTAASSRRIYCSPRCRFTAFVERNSAR